MVKLKKRQRPASPTSNDSPSKKIKPILDASEHAAVENEHSSLATEVKQREEILNATVLEWIETREKEGVTLHPPDEEFDDENEDEGRIDQLLLESILGSFKKQLKGWSKEEKLKSFKYECEWKKCSFMTGKDQRYFRHVELHAEEVQIGQEGVYTCLWDLCGFSTTVHSDFFSHVHVHAYHTKLKVHGASLSTLAHLPKCGYDSRSRNDISKFPLNYTCEWQSCGEKFDRIMPFAYHVAHHFYDQLPPGRKTLKEPIVCMWSLCRISFKSISCGLRHLIRHTKQSAVSCFSCGALFFDRTIYRSHCIRQVDLRYRKFKCDECGKYFPTERLLKNHADIHILHVPCPRCPAKFSTPAIMTSHLRRVHLKVRPVLCTQCEYRTYTVTELKKHMIRHSARRLFRCDEFGCNATFRCENSLKIHIVKHYNLPAPHYACHLCEAGYGSGWLLSKHLGFAHELTPKPGYCRYRYKIDPEDGFYKLDLYIENKRKEQTIHEKAQEEGSEGSSDDDDDHDDTAQHVKPVEAKTTINDMKMIGENEIAIELGMELNEGNTDQSDEQTTATESVSIKTENNSPFKTNENPESVELKEDKKSKKIKKVQEFTVMKRYLKND